MEFLAGLKEAKSQGLTKDEFMVVWSREMDKKTAVTAKTDNSTATPTRSNEELERDINITNKDESLLILRHILEDQQQLKHHQDNIQQQLTNLQANFLVEQNKVQSQHDEKHNHLLGKLTALENSLAKMQLTLADSVRKTMHSENVDIQEKLSLMTETIHNHTLEEIRRILCAPCGKIEETRALRNDISTGGKQSPEDKDMSENKKLKEDEEEKPENIKNSSLCSEIVMPKSVKDVLHYELNSFLVNVQKLLLRPISSEDLSFLVTEKIQEFCQREQENIVDQLLNIQVALSSDFSARLYKTELHLIQELKDMSSQLNQQGQMELVRSEVQKMVREINEVKDVLHLTLPRTIVALVKSQTFSEVNRGKQEDVLTGTSSIGAANDQLMSLVMLMSLYMIVFVLYNDQICGPTSNKKVKTMTRSVSKINMSDFDSSSWATESMKNAESLSSLLNTNVEGFEHQFSKTLNVDQNQKHPEDFEEVKVRWEINYTDLSPGEDVFLKVKHIPPGYNLMLRATKFSESLNLNFFARAASGKLNKSLDWPADFTFKVEPVPKNLLDSNKKLALRFKKNLSMLRPKKYGKEHSGASICYLKTENILSKYIHDDLVTVNVYVKFAGNTTEDTPESV